MPKVSKTRLIFFGVLSLLLPSTARAQVVVNNHVEAELIPQLEMIVPGQPFTVALRMKMDEDWHTYWKNPGDSGLATVIKWNLPEKFGAGEIIWPLPHKIEVPPLTTYGYDGEIFLLTEIKPPADLKTNEILTINARAEWLACKEVCIPGHGHFTLQIPSGNGISKDPRWGKVSEFVRGNFPIKQEEWKEFFNIDFDVAKKGVSIYITPKISDWRAPNPLLSFRNNVEKDKKRPSIDFYFYSENAEIIDHAAPQVILKNKNAYILKIPRSELSDEKISSLKGLLSNTGGWIKNDWRQALEISLGIDKLRHSDPALAGEESNPDKILRRSAPQNDGNRNPLIILLFAFLGGIILNLMPCVLPVLSLKLLNLAEHARRHPEKTWKESLVFTLGVLVSFWALAGLLILLKAAGYHLGWGFQFQSPGFVVFLIVLFFTLALNLFGVFEIPGFSFLSHVSSKEGRFKESFLTGVLATVSATPCTAPFMGVALGVALAQSGLIAFLIFTFLGLGLAFPYLLVGRFPRLLRFLPRPGVWMVHLKKVLGFLLLATVVWLAWVLWVQLQPKIFRAHSSSRVMKENLDWKPYSPELLSALQKEGRIVFVNFTAAWCLTCQVNERAALENKAVQERFKNLNVALLKADWTNYNEKITTALAGLGKNSIPVYVLYGKNSDPVLLPEILTPSIVLKALDNLSSRHSDPAAVRRGKNLIQ